MILCDTEIWAALNSNQIIIEPKPEKDRVKTTSVDLTLGGDFMTWATPTNDTGEEFYIDPFHPKFDYNAVAKKYQAAVPVDKNGSIVLEPGSLVLALTTEKVELPETSRIAARVEGRSGLARLGLAIHLTAPTIHAGFRGKITLEITNQGKIPLRLRPGLPICQLIFEQVFGTPTAAMKGAFQDQESVQGRSTKE